MVSKYFILSSFYQEKSKLPFLFWKSCFLVWSSKKDYKTHYKPQKLFLFIINFSIMKLMQELGYVPVGCTSLPLTQVDSQDHKSGYVTKSVTKEEFSGYFDLLNEVDDDTNSSQISEQFKQLAIFSPPPPSSHTTNYSAAAQQFNRSKNRYINILPCKLANIKDLWSKTKEN